MIYDRLMFNDKGETYLPGNVEGNAGANTTKFFTAGKGLGLLTGALLNVFMGMQFVKYALLFRILAFLIMFIIDYFLFDRFILETPFFKKAFARLRQNRITTPGIDYGIMYFNKRENGTSVGFIDGGIGVFVKLVRESQVGRPEDYVEAVKSAFSDFLLNLHDQKYTLIKCNVMQQAIEDPRLNMLEEQIKSVQYPTVKSILQLNLGVMKNNAYYAFYDQDIYLIYTTDSKKLNSIIDDTIKLTNPLLKVGFLSRKIMDEADIVDLHIKENGVSSFNVLKAKSLAFENKKSSRSFELYSIKFKNGNELVLDKKQINKLKDLYEKYVYNRNMKVDLIKELTGDLQETYVELKPTETLSQATDENEEFIPLDIEALTEGRVTKDVDTKIKTTEDLIENEDLGV